MSHKQGIFRLLKTLTGTPKQYRHAFSKLPSYGFKVLESVHDVWQPRPRFRAVLPSRKVPGLPSAQFALLLTVEISMS